MLADPLDWNLVVTSIEGRGMELRRALRPILKLHGTGFHNVFVARADHGEATLASVAELSALEPRLDEWLARIIPVEHTFPVELDGLNDRLESEAERFLDRLAGQSFHVRVERRGHKGTIHAHHCELAVGDHLYERLERRGLGPRVVFDDPDVVVAIELVGDVGGAGLVTRDLRQRFRFVRID